MVFTRTDDCGCHHGTVDPPTKTHWMLPIAIGLYLYGEFAGSSAVVTGMSAPIYTRNGPFFSTLFVVVGYLIRERHILWQSRSALLLAMLGMAFHFVEAYGLHQYGQCLTPMIICLAPLCGRLGCFFSYSLNPI